MTENKGRQLIVPGAEGIMLEFGYGNEWREKSSLLESLQKTLEKGKRKNNPLDQELAEKTVQLFEKHVNADRSGHIQSDLNKLSETSKDIKIHHNILQGIYGLTKGELNEEIQRHNNAIYSGHSLSGLFKVWKDDLPGRFSSRYHAFANLDIITEDDKYKLRLAALHDGGNNDISYPLHELSFELDASGKINMDFMKFFFRDASKLRDEVTQHQEIIDHVKRGMVNIIDFYLENPDEFYKQRVNKTNSEEDKTQLYDVFYDYLFEVYLKKKLDKKDYETIISSIEVLYKENFLAAVRLAVINKLLIDKEDYSSVVREDSWFSKNNKEELNQLIETTKNELSKIGAEFDEGGLIINLSDLINECLVNKKTWKKVNKLWEKIRKESYEPLYTLYDQHLARWETLYRSNIYKSIVVRGLELARGLIIQTSDSKKESMIASFLFNNARS